MDMKLTDTLKDIMGRTTKKKFDTEDMMEDNDPMIQNIADEVRNDPQYKPVIEKLRILRAEQDEHIHRLKQIDLEIETCLLLISINREREQLK